MMVVTTSIYAAVLTALYIYLSFQVIGRRRGQQISLGTGEDRLLEKRVRAHGNFAEYAPLGIVLLALAELNGAPAVAVHGLGLLLTAGRAMHAYAFLTRRMVFKLRVAGMVSTFAALAFSALAALAYGLAG
ncbi:MAG: MAPEG family protein [Hyphomicrobiaceae bacterium]|nr:MAPEG family protein [Hyphomicrobiaceae bacterium]